MHMGGMKYALGATFLFAAAACGQSGPAQGANAGPNDAPNPYHLDADWAKPPLGRNFGSTIGVDLDPDGQSIWVYDRCGGNTCSESAIAPIQKFDANGNLVAAFGQGLFNFPHGLGVDRQGNVYVTDATEGDRRGHTVTKFSPTGEVLLTLGQAGVAGATENTFNRPSDVAVAANGDIYVADGHGGESNARVVKFASDGTFITAWGTLGDAPGEFNQAHAIAIDSQGRVFVGDRNNNRIQIFDADGNYLDEWRQFGRPSGLFIDGNNMLYVADSQSDDMLNPGFAQGVRIGSVSDGVVTEFLSGPDMAGASEGIAADSEGNIFVGYTGDYALKRFVK
ncbi:MAG: hypothetical protein RJB62_1862 [Pseudomonadota bacterium]|jgi:DNA-binding beta-propeller fold protein YncE